MKKFKAFTLSELNIALLVLGILCALVIPAIVNVMPSQNRVMIKRAYYNVSNIVYTLINNTNLYDIRNKENISIFRGFEDTNKVTYKGEDYEGDSKFNLLFISQLNTEGDIDDTTSNCNFTESGVTLTGCHRVTTADGMIWTLGDKTITVGADGVAPITEVVSYMLIDVNGNKAPNCYEGSSACSGLTEEFDQFRLKVYVDGMIEIDKDDTWVKNMLKANSSITPN